MISAEKASKKKIEKFVDAAQKLAAVQYLYGLHPDNPKIKEKADKTWQEFQLAADTILNQKIILIKQENGSNITLDKGDK